MGFFDIFNEHYNATKYICRLIKNAWYSESYSGDITIDDLYKIYEYLTIDKRLVENEQYFRYRTFLIKYLYKFINQIHEVWRKNLELNIWQLVIIFYWWIHYAKYNKFTLSDDDFIKIEKAIISEFSIYKIWDRNNNNTVSVYLIIFNKWFF